jgi:hypothetical protein
MKKRKLTYVEVACVELAERLVALGLIDAPKAGNGTTCQPNREWMKENKPTGK